MIEFQFFPRSRGVTAEMAAVINCFKKVESKIESPQHELKSNEVLQFVEPHLRRLNYKVEIGKGKGEKIDVPVLFGIIAVR